MRSKKGFPSDIADMHTQFPFKDWVASAPFEKKVELLRLRMMMFNEETAETQKAFYARDAEELVDGLIDTIVIAVGTLDLFGVDANLAWDRVHQANMDKQVGVKPGRPNPLGLPDLVKPDGWSSPSHSDNLGTLPDVLRG